MTPTANVVQILKNNQIEGVDSKNIHAFLIPQNDWDLKPIIQVNEIMSIPDGFGNNDVTRDELKIQIQIYYPSEYTGDMTSIENSIKAVMKENCYRVADNGIHVVTPDGNTLITLKFNFTKETI